MPTIDDLALKQFVNDNIDIFHTSRLHKLEQTKLTDILRKKNPYLFRAKNITTAADLVKDLLEAVLYASEEKFMGDFLERQAIFVVQQLWNGYKSPATGIDLEFIKNGTRYLVSVKSGPSWSNSSSANKQVQDFNKAVSVIRQQSPQEQLQPVIGICYSKIRTSYKNGIQTVRGQLFWELLTDDPDFYTKIVEPIGYRAQAHNEVFLAAKARILNLFAVEFTEKFCDDGIINWERLVTFNSHNR